MASGTGIARRQHEVAGELMFDVEVELLDPAQFEIPVLGLHSTREVRGIWRRTREGKKELSEPERLVEHSRTGQFGKANGVFVSAKKGGFSHSPCAPWFQDESWKIA